jgi:hypothetical protein
MSGSSTLRGELGAILFSGFVCVAPLRLGGLKGEKSTPSVGWEVLLRSHGLASRSWTKNKRGIASLKSSTFVTVSMCKIALVNLLKNSV